MADVFSLKVFLPIDRWMPGFARLYEGRQESGPIQLLYDIPCRGKADNTLARNNGNPTRDPTKPWGDTPSGFYEPRAIIHYEPEHHTFGRLALLLEGTAGDALTARENGRTGLAIHANRGNERLMATYGCIRLFDRDIAMLARAVAGAPIGVQVIDCEQWPPF